MLKYFHWLSTPCYNALYDIFKANNHLLVSIWIETEGNERYSKTCKEMNSISRVGGRGASESTGGRVSRGRGASYSSQLSRAALNSYY